MGKVWVLDTETKGTGANMVPLERILRRPGSDPPARFVFPKRKPAVPAPPEPRGPRRFKVVDVMTLQVLAEGTDVRATVNVLERVRSIVDITVYVWDRDPERWRMLTLDETRALWEYRGRTDGQAAAED